MDDFPVEIVPLGIPGQFILPVKEPSEFTSWNDKGFLIASIDVHGNSWYKHPFEYEWMVFDSMGKEVTKESLLPFEGLNVYYLYSQPNLSWFATDKGLVIWEKDAERPRYLFEEFPDLFTNIFFNNFDSGKTMWSWNTSGILHIRVNPTNFSSFTKDQNGLFSNFILGIYPLDKNKLLIRHDFSNRYFSILDKNTRTISIIHEEELLKNYGYRPYTNYVTHGDPKSWISKHGEKIHKLPNLSTDRNPFTYHYFISDGLGFNYVIYPSDHEGKALQLWNTLFDKLVFPKIDPLQLSNQGDTVWIGTETVGLVALHTSSGKTAQWLNDPSNPSAIPANRVHVVIPTTDGNLWLGTGKGLSYFDKKEGKFTTLTTKDGLIDDRIYCMVVDRKGLLWIGTGKGISRFDTNTKTFTNFTKADGLINSEYNRNSAVLLEDGTILMGGMEGIDIFDPEKVEERLEKPRPFVAHIHNSDKLINQKSQADFGHEENHLDFYVSADPIWMASTLTYQYKLEGAETDWQSLNYSNVVRYPNLPPGSYRFQVKIANQTDIATYAFTIQPIWYATWWFRLAFVLASLSLIYLIYRIMITRRIEQIAQENKIIQLKAEQAQSVTKERERIIADLHDDVGATLSSLHIYGDLAGKVWTSQPEKGKEMVDKIKEQSRDLMVRMSDIIWSMKSSGEEKQSFALRLKNYGTDLLASKNIEVIYEIDEELASKTHCPEIRKNLLMIGKEAMNNIAKHSQAKKVKIQLAQDGNELVFKISDDGKGFELVDYQMGNGLGNIQQRCLKMEGKFNVESVNGWGTQISCRVPIARISLVD